MLRIILIATLVIWASFSQKSYGKEINDFKELLERGIKSMKQAEHEEAVHYFKKAISIDPENYNGYFQLGFGLHQLNKYQEAIKAYKFGFKLKPDYFYSGEAYFNMTVAADKIGLGTEAIKYLKKSLQAYTDRSDYGAVYKVGEYLKELNDKYPEPIQ